MLARATFQACRALLRKWGAPIAAVTIKRGMSSRANDQILRCRINAAFRCQTGRRIYAAELDARINRSGTVFNLRLIED
jgi:hypothetical protein